MTETQTEQSREYEITNPTQDLVERVFKEISLTPYKAEIGLRVNGIAGRLSEDEYLKRCEQIGVMPKSRLDFEFQGGLFIPTTNHSYPAVPVYFLHESWNRKRALDMIVTGGKFAEVGFRFEDENILLGSEKNKEMGKKMFEQLRSQVSAFTDGGYDITKYELGFSGTKNNNHYCGLYFVEAKEATLGLDIRYDAKNTGHAKRLRKFFDSLKE